MCACVCVCVRVCVCLCVCVCVVKRVGEGPSNPRVMLTPAHQHTYALGFLCRWLPSNMFKELPKEVCTITSLEWL